MLDDEDLRKQLLRTPEMHIDRVARTSSFLLADAARLQLLNQKYPGPAHALIAKRTDLAGLPMRMDPECKLGKEPAEKGVAASTDGGVDGAAGDRPKPAAASGPTAATSTAGEA